MSGIGIKGNASKERDSIGTWLAETPSERLVHCLDTLTFWHILTPHQQTRIASQIASWNETEFITTEPEDPTP